MEREKRFLVPLIRGIYTTSYIIYKNITLLGIIMFVMIKSAIQVPPSTKTAAKRAVCGSLERIVS